MVLAFSLCVYLRPVYNRKPWRKSIINPRAMVTTRFKVQMLGYLILMHNAVVQAF